jgi:hypothetical protein
MPDSLVVWTNPVKGRESEYNSWYNEIHLPEVIAVPGFVAATRYELSPEPRRMPGVPEFVPAQRYLAIYELEEGVSHRAAWDALNRARPGFRMSDALGDALASVFSERYSLRR